MTDSIHKQHLKFVDDNDFLGRMLLLTGNRMFHDLRNASDNCNADFTDALSWGQLQSKRWLVDELTKCNVELGTVFLCAGWYATLASMLFNSKIKVDKVRSFDIDPNCATIAETVNRTQVLDSWQFKATTTDIMNLEFDNYTYSTERSDGTSVELCESADTIINTSCEHIENFDTWYNMIPKGKLVVLQSNDYFDLPEHVNCVKDGSHFAETSPLSNVYFTGELKLSKYTRYMRIGIR